MLQWLNRGVAVVLWGVTIVLNVLILCHGIVAMVLEYLLPSRLLLWYYGGHDGT